MLIRLKAERKELLSIIEHNKIETQGNYRLIKENRESRSIKVEEYRKLVSEEDFLKSIVVPVKNAVKYISEKEAMGITYKKHDQNVYVIKE
jgi:hypothetical protein